MVKMVRLCYVYFIIIGKKEKAVNKFEKDSPRPEEVYNTGQHSGLRHIKFN